MSNSEPIIYCSNDDLSIQLCSKDIPYSNIGVNFKNVSLFRIWWALITLGNLHNTALSQNNPLSLSSRSSLCAAEEWQEAVEVGELKELQGSFTSLATGRTGQTNTTLQKAQRVRERASPAPATTDSDESRLLSVSYPPLQHNCRLTKKTLQRAAHANVNAWEWNVCLFSPVWSDKHEINSERLVQAGSNIGNNPFLALIGAFEVCQFRPTDHLSCPPRGALKL